jgi:predicted 3-demethylubiquinone-9 3-methyltransferase (glyoxalase superfamily)
LHYKKNIDRRKFFNTRKTNLLAHSKGIIKMTESIYKQNGYENRKDYLECLADDFGIDFQIVVNMAQILGQDEDFDGLITALEDNGSFE